MKVAIATVQVPFIDGGAEDLTAGLDAALRRAGHTSVIVSIYIPIANRTARNAKFCLAPKRT